MLDNQASHRYLSCVLLFVLLATALIGACWHLVQSAGVEAGDFAANSLLVQDAKRLHLIYGNYSRVGFNHPGPAILYVHAFGELLFHDWLHVVRSPFGGQVLASLLYNAAWMVLVFAVVRRFAGQAQALLFLAVLVLVTLGIDPALVNGMWFPDLYVLPYAAMLVSIAPLAHGRADTLKALAISSGFLINGHASFIPMLGVMLILMLAANWLISRRERSRRIVSRAWLAGHWRQWGAALLILFLFLVPLLIATVKNYPGPLHDYVHYGQDNKGNPWPDAARFVLAYWGTGKMLIAGRLLALMLAVLLLSGPRAPREGEAPHDFVRNARALGIAFAAATVALLYYAKAGVDDLAQVYVALFYYSVPAMSAALVALFACRMIPAGVRAPATALAAALVLAACWPWLRQDPFYAYNYDQPDIARLYQQLQSLPGSGRIVLDLGPGELVWADVVGVQAYAARRHVDLVCVNQGWHISHTRTAQCRPEEVAANRRYEVLAVDGLDPARGEPDLEAQGVALFRAGAPVRPLAFVTVRQQPDYFKRILGQGWSGVEGDFVWSDGPVAHIHLPPDPARGRTLTLDLGAFLPRTDFRQQAAAYVNGRLAGQMEWRYFVGRHRFSIDLGPDPGAEKHIELRIAHPVRPMDFDPGTDGRHIGLSLYGIKKDPA